MRMMSAAQQAFVDAHPGARVESAERPYGMPGTSGLAHEYGAVRVVAGEDAWIVFLDGPAVSERAIRAAANRELEDNE